MRKTVRALNVMTSITIHTAEYRIDLLILLHHFRHWEQISNHCDVLWNTVLHISRLGGNVGTVKHVKYSEHDSITAGCVFPVETNTAILDKSTWSAYDHKMMSLGCWIIHSVFLLHFFETVTSLIPLHSVTQTFTAQQNTLTLNKTPPPGWSSFSPTFYLSLAEVSQQGVQVPAVSSRVQRALSHHAESHAQGGPDVVRHHGGCGTSRPPCSSCSISGGLALKRQSFEEVLHCLSEEMGERKQRRMNDR